MNVILLGAPGAGKGTQGAILAERTGLPRVATGDLLRAAVDDKTPLGEQAASYMHRGLLVPDEIILSLIQQVLESPQAANGIIMDGFPRTVAQAEAVEKLLSARGTRVDHAVTFNVPEPDLVQRLLGRASQEGRTDDTPEAIRKRLVVYRELTEPLIEFFQTRGILREIDGVGSVEDIAERVMEAVGA